MMQSEVFEAFRAIGTPEDKALRAAEALSRRDKDVSGLKYDMMAIQHDMAVLRWTVGTLRWMVGILYPLMLAILAILLKLFMS